ncbi:cubilin-like isoform X2 [Tubulanus polymorphus]
MRQSTDCNDEFIEIVDVGTHRRSPKSCATWRHRGRIWYSDSNKVQILLKTYKYSSSDSRGYRIVFEAVEKIQHEYFDGCDGFMKASTGVVTSPRYPNWYPDRIDCKVTINVEPGTIVKITFDDFYVYTCGRSSLEIKDLSTSRSERYCGEKFPEFARVWQSDSNRVQIHFQVDPNGSQDNLRGYKLSYEAVKPNEIEYSDGCNGVVRQTSGTVTSWGFPNNFYRKGENCKTQFRLPDGVRVVFKFEVLELYGRPGSCTDFVLLRDLESQKETAKLCANRYKNTIWVSDSNRIDLIFSSSSNSQLARGYKLTYEAVKKSAGKIQHYDGCNGYLKKQTGVISSPNYPNDLDYSYDCRVVLEVNQGQKIRVDFTDFNLVYSTYPACSNDYVMLDDLETGASTGKMCGRRFSGRTWVSTSNRIRISLHTSPRDQSNRGRGFSAKYTAIDTTTPAVYYDGCNGFMTLPYGVLTSPNYPGTWYDHDKCRTIIQVQPGKKIKFHFDDVELAHAFPECRVDSLQIRDLVSSKESLKLCGTKVGIGKEWISDSNRAEVSFISGKHNSHTYNGFKLRYQQVEPKDDEFYDYCDGLLRAETGELRSPNYPDEFYEKALCRTRIHVPTGKKIVIDFIDFHLINALPNCPTDSLEIIDMNSRRTSERQCGSAFNRKTWVSDSNRVELMFRSDSRSSNSRGFKAKYKTVPANKPYEYYDKCSGYLTAPSGDIKSPNYPDTVEPYTSCDVIVAVDEGLTIRFDIKDLSLRSSGFFLELRDLKTSKSTGMLNGQNSDAIGTRWVSDSNKVHIILRMQGGINSEERGYWLHYQALTSSEREVLLLTTTTTPAPTTTVPTLPDLCGKTLSDTSGEISSPSYPLSYPNNRNCVINIQAATGMRVHLKFEEFNLEGGSGCRNDYVLIEDVISGRKSGNMCGTRPKGADWLSTSNKVKVTFKSDGSINKSGYKALFKQVDSSFVLPDSTTGASSGVGDCPCGLILHNNCLCKLAETNPDLTRWIIDSNYDAAMAVINNIG